MSAKTFIIKSLAFGLSAGTVNIQNTTTRQPLSNGEILDFVTSQAANKQELYKAIKPMLTRGGFVFDPTLWQWEIKQPSPYRIDLWVTITFVNDDSWTKQEFMDSIKATGILKFDHQIIKNYS